MAKKFSKLSLLLWGGVLLAILFFVFGVGRREGFFTNCSSLGKSSCANSRSDRNTKCKWNRVDKGDGFCSDSGIK